eukprot:m.478001 g.478001  ORF g.478001 m.478001 type:complete len:141 (-) comp45433_c0_seq1:232-654(-)
MSPQRHCESFTKPDKQAQVLTRHPFDIYHKNLVEGVGGQARRESLRTQARPERLCCTQHFVSKCTKWWSGLTLPTAQHNTPRYANTGIVLMDSLKQPTGYDYSCFDMTAHNPNHSRAQLNKEFVQQLGMLRMINSNPTAV